MKVVILAPLPPPSGGIASWANRMKNVKLKNNWKVEIVDEKVIGGREIFGDNTRKNIFIEIKRCFKIWKKLCSVLNDEEVKIVHSNIPAGVTGMLREIVCAYISKFYGKKFIIHYRCTISNMVKNKVQIIVFKILTQLSDAAIVLNTPSEKFLKKYCKVPVYLIPNFVLANELINKKEMKKEKFNKRVLYVGGVIEEKGCIDIINLAKSIEDVEFRLVGKISPEVKNYKITKNVTLSGEVNREIVQKELEDADIFLFPSFFHGEGFSNSLAEAMAYGLPCIVSDWAANADMIEEKGGIVVPIHDLNKLKVGIKKLLDSNELRSEMGEWNKKKAMSEYSESKITSQYVEIYEKLLRNVKRHEK